MSSQTSMDALQNMKTGTVTKQKISPSTQNAYALLTCDGQTVYIDDSLRAPEITASVSELKKGDKVLIMSITPGPKLNGKKNAPLRQNGQWAPFLEVKHHLSITLAESDESPLQRRESSTAYQQLHDNNFFDRVRTSIQRLKSGLKSIFSPTTS